MNLELTPPQQKWNAAFRAFSDTAVAPFANGFDEAQQIPASLVQSLAQEGYLGAIIPAEFGGLGLDMITFGLLNEHLGRGCSSVRSLLTVHSMASYAVLRWGSKAQKEQYLVPMARGEVVGAFALTEPEVGSDAKSIQTTAVTHPDGYVLNGRKKWITFGQIANLFLVFAHLNNKPVAFLVPSTTAGLTITPIKGMLGTTASMLAELHFEECLVPANALIGGKGFGITGVALSALNIGRYSVAWGCVGIAQASLEASLAYITTREQFGAPLEKYQLIREMITNMYTNIKAARLLCYQAGQAQQESALNAVQETLVAKYFASTTATRIASDAVQIHGANGCSTDYPVGRYFRDAKVMEIIEGSTQMQQIMIAEYVHEAHTKEQILGY